LNITLKKKQENVGHIGNKYCFFIVKRRSNDKNRRENNSEIQVGDKSILTFARK